MADFPDQLQPASFRGVPFEVESTSATVGRTTVTHRYPQRTPSHYVEDMGAEPLVMPLTAFVLDPDHTNKRDALMKALQKPGPGVLVHPTLGRLVVNARPATVTEQLTTEGGMTRFDLEFVESGELVFPWGRALPRQQTKDAVTKSREAVSESFEDSFDLEGAVWLLKSAAGEITELLDDLSERLQAPSTAVVTAIDDLHASAFAHQLTIAADIVTAVAAIADALDTDTLGVTTDSPVVADEAQHDTDTARQAAANKTAVRRLFQRMQLTALAGRVLDTEFTSVQEAQSKRDAVGNALAAEADAAEDRDVYDALSALRLAVIADVTSRAADLARLETVNLPEPISALVLAWDRYADASRAAEIIDLNDAAHGGFLPRRVQVLAS